ncbi:hypothetical protein OUZ56_010598 [Daphnia magna]|uniref:Uncharacterized protein n=1 Tax=Daphnia magna TaxID=35525 RepID=A0ABR0AIZ5_9CRUS|nr:hypothetical protein OUZ56_010598 [Daphnia magna]
MSPYTLDQDTYAHILVHREKKLCAAQAQTRTEYTVRAVECTRDSTAKMEWMTLSVGLERQRGGADETSHFSCPILFSFRKGVEPVIHTINNSLKD